MKSKWMFLAALSLSAIAQAQVVNVEGPWARATVPGQRATGAFMQLQSKDGAKLVGGASAVAGVVEIHEMKLDGGVMKMRAIPGGLDLPAGQTVELKPGGYHVMLMDLKAPLEVGSVVPMTLVFKDSKGVESKVEVKAKVGMQAPGAAAGAHPAGMKH